MKTYVSKLRRIQAMQFFYDDPKTHIHTVVFNNTRPDIDVDSAAYIVKKNKRRVYLANGDWIVKDLENDSWTVIKDHKFKKDYMLTVVTNPQNLLEDSQELVTESLLVVPKEEPALLIEQAASHLEEEIKVEIAQLINNDFRKALHPTSPEYTYMFEPFWGICYDRRAPQLLVAVIPAVVLIIPLRKPQWLKKLQVIFRQS